MVKGKEHQGLSVAIRYDSFEPLFKAQRAF